MQYQRLIITLFIFISIHIFTFGQYEDCNSAYNVPDKTTLNVPNVYNFGNVKDPVIEDFTQCFQGNEDKSYWIKFKALTSGTFEFALTPNGLMADYDFILYDACPCDTNRNVIACKWQGSVVTNFKPTGIATDPMASFGIPPIDALEFTNTINLVAGKSYFMLLNNITASLDPTNDVGFSLVFGGTANIGLVDDNQFGIQNLNFTGPDIVCLNQKNVNYVGNASSTLGYPISYYWKANNGITFNDDSLKNVLADFSLSGGVICLKASDGCYAPKSICKNIAISSTPDVTALDTMPCHNNSFDLKNLNVLDFNNSLGNLNYFDKGLNAFTNIDSISNIIKTSGRYFIRKTVNSNCFDTSSVDIVIQNIKFQKDTFRICSDETRLDTLPVNEINGNKNLIYTFYPDSISASKNINILTNPLVKNSGTYWIRGDSKEGCYSISPLIVEFLPYPVLPSITNYYLCDSCLLVDTFSFPSLAQLYTTKIYPSIAFASLDFGQISNVMSCKSESYGVKVVNANGCYTITELDITKINPSTCILVGSDSICKNVDKEIQLNFNYSGTAPFTAIFSNGSSNDSITTNQINYIHKVTVNKATNFTLTNLKDGNYSFCQNAKISGSFNVKELSQPNIKSTNIICDSTRKSYKIQVEIEGGNGNYLVNGSNIVGTSFLSNPILNDSIYNFLIQDSYKCIPDTVKGVATCECTNSAGYIDEMDTLVICKTDIAFATAYNFKLDPEDKLEFILHDGSGNKIGNIVANGVDPIFSYNPNIITNKVYYLSTIVGDSLPDGTVNQKDICLSVAPGRPIVFLTPDTVSLGLDTSYCLGSLIDLKFYSNKLQNLDIIIDINGVNTNLANYNIANSYPLNINVQTQIQLLAANDQNLCPLEIGRSTQDISVIKKLSTNNLTLTCDSINENYSVKFVADADPKSNVQIDGLTGNWLGNVFTSDLIKSGSNYNFVIKDQFLCDTFLLKGSKTCDCNKLIGIIDTISKNVCFGDTLNVKILKSNESDKNDTTLFALFSDINLTNLVGVTNSPLFTKSTFNGLNFNTPYYITLITGNKLLNYPFVDLSFCHAKTLPQKIIFLDKPTLSIANTIETICPNDTFFVNGTISGSLPAKFNIDNQIFTINSSSFSIPIVSPTAMNYSVKVIDNLGCITNFSNVFQTQIRPKSILGSFSLDTIETCVKDTINFGIIGQSKYKDDSIYYKIETLTNTFIAYLKEPKFYLFSNMNANQYYKITMVAFPIKNGTINPKSNCVEQSKPAYIRFYDLPTASINAINQICLGDSLSIQLNNQNDINTYEMILSIDNQIYKYQNVKNSTVIKIVPKANSIIKLKDLIPQNSSIICKPNVDSSDLIYKIKEAPQLISSKIICASNKLTYQVQIVVSSEKINTLSATGITGNWTNNTFLSNSIISGTNYSITITDANGCKELIVNGIGDCSCPSNAKPEISIDRTISCNNQSDGILSVKNINGTPPFIFNWSNNITGATNKNLKGGFYFVTMTDRDNCQTFDTINLKNPDLLDAIINTINPPCPDVRLGSIIIENTFGGTPPYSYQLDNQVYGTIPRYDELIAGKYNLTVADKNGCKRLFNIQITDPEQFTIKLINDTIIDYGDSILLNWTSNQIATKWTWSKNVICADTSCMIPYAKPLLEYDLYHLTASNINGCIAEDWVKVSVKRYDDVYVPNIFSPESSNFSNQKFFIFANRSVSKIKLFEIFDRWGNRLFQSTNALPNDDSNGWDGTVDGKLINEGVYIYHAEIEKDNGQTIQIKGDFMLYRQ